MNTKKLCTSFLKTDFKFLSWKNNCWSTYASHENLILVHSDLEIKLIRRMITEYLIITSSLYAYFTQKI
jgi:hypothetical protein